MAPSDTLVRWQRALEKSMQSKGPWKSPLELHNEVALPLERQLFVLDALQEAPRETRSLIAPMMKNLMAQWLVFDALREADEIGERYYEALGTEEFHSDLRFLLARNEDIDVDSRRGPTSPEWMWDILLSIDSPLNYGNLSEEILQAILAAASQSLKDGKAAQDKGDHGRAAGIFGTALRSCGNVEILDLSSGLGALTIGSAIAVIRKDLYKGIANSCFALGLARMSYTFAEKVLDLDAEDHEAVFCKANALQLLENKGLKDWLKRRELPEKQAQIKPTKQPALPPVPVSAQGRKSRGAFSQAVEERLCKVNLPTE